MFVMSLFSLVAGGRCSENDPDAYPDIFDSGHPLDTQLRAVFRNGPPGLDNLPVTLDPQSIAPLIPGFTEALAGISGESFDRKTGEFEGATHSAASGVRATAVFFPVAGAWDDPGVTLRFSVESGENKRVLVLQGRYFSVRGESQLSFHTLSYSGNQEEKAFFERCGATEERLAAALSIARELQAAPQPQMMTENPGCFLA